MMQRLSRLLVLSVAGCLLAVPAAAQGTSEPPVSQLLPEMILSAARLAPGTAGDHAGHFEPSARSVAAINALNRSLALQLAGFPSGPTEVGVVFAPGQPGESTRRLASGFTGQALTLGRGRRAFALTYEGTTFEWIDDLNLRDSDINLFLEHTCCSGGEADRDLMQQVVSLQLLRKVVGLVMTFGLTDRLDVGIVVPIVEVAADARVTSYIIRTATDGEPGIHAFDQIDLGNRTIPAGDVPPVGGVAGTGASTARGIGDLIVRGKLNLLRAGSSGVAVAVDLRLPTGNADEFIGLGATQVRPAVIVTAGSRRAAVRGRVEYVWSDGELSPVLGGDPASLTVPNEVLFAVGVDAAIAPRTTLVADLVGRRVPDVPRFGTTTTVFTNRGPGPLPSAPYTAEGRLDEAGAETVSLMLGMIGARVHVHDEVSATLRVLVPFGNAGLRPATSVVLGLDFGF